MPHPTPQKIWDLNEKELLTLLESGTLKPLQNHICFYAPSFSYYNNKHFCTSRQHFPTISVTGNACALNCKHCGGKVLETMHPAPTPIQLWSLGLKLKGEGAKGVLVSGGCLPDGSVPLDEAAPVLGKFKRELGLTVFVHTGIINLETALALKDAGVDAALIDVLGSDETLQKIFNINATLGDYMDSLKALNEAKLNLVPHIIVGLNNGKLDGELHALEIIMQSNPSAIVIIAFMPIHGTEMAKSPSPEPLDIAKVIATARIMFPQTPLALGCMRPKGKIRTEIDLLALKAGVDAIAFPSQEAVQYAKTQGYTTTFSSHCCAQIYREPY